MGKFFKPASGAELANRPKVPKEKVRMWDSGIKWIEFCPKFGISLTYHIAGYFDRRPMISFCLGWGAFYISLPFDTGIDECEPPKYGFYWFESALWICNGMKVHAIHAPWSWDWYRTSYLLKNKVTGGYGSDKKWEHETKGTRGGDSKEPWNEPLKSLMWSAEYPYEYVLRSGEVQKRRATVSISEREWRRKFLMWTPMFNMVRRSLDISFDDEVGEETGSWKGGCTGCSTDIKEGQEPLTVLREMERTRKFK